MVGVPVTAFTRVLPMAMVDTILMGHDFAGIGRFGSGASAFVAPTLGQCPRNGRLGTGRNRGQGFGLRGCSIGAAGRIVGESNNPKQHGRRQ